MFLNPQKKFLPFYQSNLAVPTIAMLLISTSGLLILPALPIFLKSHGATYGLIGAILASYWVGALLLQLPASKAINTFGSRKVGFVAAAIFGTAALFFAINLPAIWYLVIRMIQGMGYGVFNSSINTFVALKTEPHRRSGGFSVIIGASVAGSTLGPLIGGILGYKDITRLVILCSILSLIASLVVLLKLDGSPQFAKKTTDKVSTAIFKDWLQAKHFVPALLFFVILGATTGFYEVAWTPLMLYRHSNSIQIGLSWASYSVPFILLSPYAGKIADSHNRKFLIIMSAFFSSIFLILYILFPQPNALILLAIFEASGTAFGSPAAQGEITSQLNPYQQSKMQAIILTVQTVSTALFTLLTGFSLSNIGIGPTFIVIACFCVILTFLSLISWQNSS